MCESFGQGPREYMWQTGRLFPRLHTGNQMEPVGAPRSRLRVGIGLAVVVVFGLASRRYPFLFPSFLGKYPGDALWALMAFLGWALMKPRGATLRLAVLAWATSCLVEVSQLYQAPWINAIRATTLGHLVLGSTFSWLDIAAYTVGVSVGSGVDVFLRGAAGASADE